MSANNDFRPNQENSFSNFGNNSQKFSPDFQNYQEPISETATQDEPLSFPSPFSGSYSPQSEGYSQVSLEDLPSPVTMGSAFKSFWKNAFDFSGRASRPEFWYAFLAVSIISFVLGILAAISLFVSVGNSSYYSDSNLMAYDVGLSSGPFVLFSFSLVLIFSIATLVPMVSLTVRRLRDGGNNPAFLLLYFIPFGWLVLLIFAAQPTSPLYRF